MNKDFRERYDRLTNLDEPRASVSSKPFSKVEVGIRGARTMDELLQRSLFALELARARYMTRNDDHLKKAQPLIYPDW